MSGQQPGIGFMKHFPFFIVLTASMATVAVGYTVIVSNEWAHEAPEGQEALVERLGHVANQLQAINMQLGKLNQTLGPEPPPPIAVMPAVEKVDVNNATIQEIDMLPGIWIMTAAEIQKLRIVPFVDMDDFIWRVTGLPENARQELEGRIEFGEPLWGDVGGSP
jgi:DNA uptake protein ComE-like DNA-binding protein